MAIPKGRQARVVHMLDYELLKNKYTIRSAIIFVASLVTCHSRKTGNLPYQEYVGVLLVLRKLIHFSASLPLYFAYIYFAIAILTALSSCF